MSNRASIGGTLAGGIQDIAALLPLIGTEQCEKHVGSALTGGFLYASATSLSIFGSLGIVKGGTATLISSLSILLPQISISFSKGYRLVSFRYSGRRKWFGGKVLKDAGFELVGSVAPLIGMEGDRFRAETRLMEMLEEKHIDDVERVSVDWKSRQWNIMLVLSTILGAFLSVTPYIALLLGPASWRPRSVHLPWLFPALRIVGSCIATIACQFIIQCRVISLMKNRLLFMTLQQKLKEIHKDRLHAWLKDSNIQWDASLPAEQCIWSLEQYLSSAHANQDTKKKNSVPSTKETPENPDYITVEMRFPSTRYAESPSFDINNLHALQHQHFPAPLCSTVFISISWIFLLLSLPATVAGYIGCFTLISATPSAGNGPLIWVGLEAALSVLRVFVWASNPAFDEETEVMLRIKLSEHQPMVTTHDYNPSIFLSDPQYMKPFALIPEREFLEHITPYTGPLDQFQKPENVKLYFTVTAEYESGFSIRLPTQTKIMSLILTVLDSDMQIGVSLMSYENSFHYIDVVVKYGTISRQLEANPQSRMSRTRPWRMEDDGLFDSLETTYSYIIEALHQKTKEEKSATLFQKWDLSRKSMRDTEAHNIQSPFATRRILTLTTEDELYLDRGYEHHLKSKLIDTWSRWITTNMENLRAQGKLECWEALRDATSEKGKWELTELDLQLVWGWARRELALVTLSVGLEDILQRRMNECILQVVDTRKDERLRAWMSSVYRRVRRKRMEQERGAARKRMEGAMENASDQADKEGRPWKGHWYFLPQWEEAIKLIDKQWSLAIAQYERAEHMSRATWEALEKHQQLDSDKDRYVTLQCLRERVSHELWHDQGQFERQMAEATVEAIRKLPSNSTREQLAEVYKFPLPDLFATAKFAYLCGLSSEGKACSAMVYVAEYGPKQTVCDVIAKSTTRSVVDVKQDIVASIPPNNHLLFLSCKGGQGEEPAFVRQNRDRWPGQQTENSSMFYFTPSSVDLQSCWVIPGETIAHILVFLVSSCNLHVSLIHRADRDRRRKTVTVSLRQNNTELAKLSDISDKFQLLDLPPFVLPEGRHELILVPQSKSDYLRYYLRDILISFSPITTIESNLVEGPGPGIPRVSNLDNETDSTVSMAHVLSESPDDPQNQIESA